MSVKKTLSDYPEISFIDGISLEGIQKFYLNAMEERYEELTGRDLVMHDADPVRLIAYADCLLLYQIAQYADRAGKMSLLKYSFGDYLENIGALKGVYRMEGAKARVRMRFSLSAQRANITVIPTGTRVTAGDGKYFETLDMLEIPAGGMEGEVNAICKEIGIKGNGYKAGDLKTLVDPVPYIDTVENVTVSEGGADLESDESLAERIFLAPSSWSTAGPDDAYQYWVRTFDTAITDVHVGSPEPGLVEICFILQNGQLPEDVMIEELQEYLQNEGIRPLTDQVVVKAPDVQEYGIDVTYYINKSDRIKTSAIREQVNSAIDHYILWQKEKIGRDINPDQLRKMIVSAGAKRVEVRSPVYLRVASDAISVLNGDPVVTYGGIEDD